MDNSQNSSIFEDFDLLSKSNHRSIMPQLYHLSPQSQILEEEEFDYLSESDCNRMIYGFLPHFSLQLQKPEELNHIMISHTLHSSDSDADKIISTDSSTKEGMKFVHCVLY